jgi:hypothetical protein
MSCLPTSYAIDLRSAKFYANMKNSEKVLLRSFFEKCGHTCLHDLSIKYGLLYCRASAFTDWPDAHATYLAHPVYENEALGSKKQQWRLTPAVWHEDLSCLPIISGETLNYRA